MSRKLANTNISGSSSFVNSLGALFAAAILTAIYFAGFAQPILAV